MHPAAVFVVRLMDVSTTDDLLVRKARDGSRDALGDLFDRHWLPVWRAAFALSGSHQLAEDCAQDAFMRAFARLGDYHGPSFRAWVVRIAVNLSLDARRRDRRFVELADETIDDAAIMPVPDAALERALAELPADRRAIVVLRFWLGYSPPEVAELLGLPIGTVHSRLSRALTQLRGQLEVEDVERA